ncbi:hypothetical protein IPF86_02370 [Candidatus Nomurabacteria bacterium]|jgi:hypothetical protein|nr:MAG: hypothetical protein IPF86_02370 [Candidatus Nomurabacteria bacterium]
MKNSIILLITLVSFVTIFSSCEDHRSGNRVPRNKPFDITGGPSTVDTLSNEPIPVPIPVSVSYTFTPDSVRVTEPEEGDFLSGEGQIPATMYRTYVYFFDSNNHKFGICLNESVYNEPKNYADLGETTPKGKEIKARKMLLLDKAKDCFEQITKAELKDLIVTIENGEIVQVEQRVYPVERKIGNAIVQQDATSKLWPYNAY